MRESLELSRLVPALYLDDALDYLRLECLVLAPQLIVLAVPDLLDSQVFTEQSVSVHGHLLVDHFGLVNVFFQVQAIDGCVSEF